MIEARDPPQIGCSQSFRRDTTGHERALQRLDGLLGRIERLGCGKAQFPGGRGQ